MNPFQTTEQLRDAFGVAENGVYQEFIAFKDGKAGFSIKRPYPQDIPFKPPVKKDGSPDTFAMIRVLYNPENIAADRLDLAKVPVWIDISKHSKYHYSHFGYNFEDDDCPTQESLAVSLSTPQPVNLQFIDDFFFDHGTSQFLNKTGKHISGLNVLNGRKIGGQVLLFDILISRDKRRCSSDLIIDFGLTRNELRNILDPKDIYGTDFPGETFCVFKEKEEKQHNEYRTRRLVLEI